MKFLSEFLQGESLEAFSIWESAKSHAVHVSGLNVGAQAMLVASRFLKEPQTTLLVARDYRSAETWIENLESLVGKNAIRFLPGIGLKPYEEKVPFDGVLEERLRFFADYDDGTPRIVICPLDSLLLKLPRPGILQKKTLHFRVGEVYEVSELRKQLLEMGFHDQPLVSGVGEFSLRGCILDINGFLYEHPVRLEFFGDELESIRFFDIFSQRSIETVNEIFIYPMGEFCIPAKVRFELNNDLSGLWWKRSEYEALENSIFDYLPNSVIVFEEAGSLAENASRMQGAFESRFKDVESAYANFPPEKIWWKYSDFFTIFGTALSLDITRVQAEASGWQHVELREQGFESSGVDATAEKIQAFVADGGRVYLVAQTTGALSRLQQLLGDCRIEGYLEGYLSEGFWLESEKIAFLTDARIFNRHQHKARKRSVAGSVSGALLVESLSRGDLVAHEDHGVGRYLGLVRVEVNGGMVDCALLEYAGGDRLRFPVSDLQKIERMQQPDEGVEVKLNKLGSAAWEKQKKRVKEKVIKIARELVELYAKREVVKGFAFPPDSKMQEEFEAEFEYTPTPDQVTATADIKRDMENGKPMDRLICGDVGFGKTEVAMRAVFKCIEAKKQVAILVPTTILAAQHYENFCERFAGFPVNIALLNRYKTAKEKKGILEKLSKHAVDIVVGTHSLLTEKDYFHDLGLLVIDEEQKFGVKQKERLRELRLTVDTLSMSATPIPRTLRLSLTGVRDISLINTPPMNRLPVETTLMKRNDKILAEAIRNELARGGQVFVVNDRVQTIEKLAEDVESWVPEARVAVAHGQMENRDLERMMNAFLSGQFDVLVSTSIIESGLDVPRANTMIIMNAHHFGISQLYQMRGRVGRSDVLAYAYLVTPEKGEVSKDAARRLEALAQFTDLGSGYQLAMRDLEIRGAGNLLGEEQHGFIAEVGTETYMRLVKEAVEMLRGIATEKPVQPRVELGVDAFLPETWIEDGLTRINLYQRIARVSTLDEIKNIRVELKDRFGELPAPAEMLLVVTEIGLCAAYLKIQGLLVRRDTLAITFVEFPPLDPRTLAEILSLSPYPMRYLSNTPLQAIIELGKGTPTEVALRALECFRKFEERSDAPLQIAKPLN